MEPTHGMHVLTGSGNRIEHSVLNITQVNQAAPSHARDTVRERLAGAASPRAFYDPGQVFDAPKCHPGTRTAVLERIMNWIEGEGDFDGKRYALWMHGPAGTGKTAIAHTIAEQCRQAGWLLATFFFFRSDPTRNNATPLIPTLAYQAIATIPPLKDFVGHTLDTHPLILGRSVGEQLEMLLMEPVDHLGYSGSLSKSHPYVVIIDGLDECDSRDMQREILAVFAKALNKPGREHYIRFLIISRPEFEIEREFKSGAISSLSFQLSLNDSFQAYEDIRLFLQDKFKEIKRNHPLRASIPDGWPERKILDELVRKSSGHFIYASTVVKHTDEARRSPSRSLDMVLGLRPSKNNPFAELDELYTYILSSADDISIVLRILTVLLLCNRDSVRYIQEDLGEDADVVEALADLPSLVEVNPERSLHIKIHHASLHDFLIDKKRSRELYIDDPQTHTELACRHLRRRNKDEQYPRCLDGHLGRANPTPGLHDALLHFTVAFIGSSNDRGNVDEALFFFPDVMVILCEREFPDKIQRHAAGVLAEILHRHLEFSSQDQDEAAVSHVHHQFINMKRHRHSRLEEDVGAVQETIFFDTSEDDKEWWYPWPSRPVYSDFVPQVLRTCFKHRSHTFTPPHITFIARKCLKYHFHPRPWFINYDLILYHPTKQHRRRRSWKRWYPRLRPTTQHSRQYPYQRLDSRLPIWIPSEPKDPTAEQMVVFQWAIHTLIRLLPHAERSEAILRMTVDPIFRRASIFFPAEIKRLRRVISEYRGRFVGKPCIDAHALGGMEEELMSIDDV